MAHGDWKHLFNVYSLRERLARWREARAEREAIRRSRRAFGNGNGNGIRDADDGEGVGVGQRRIAAATGIDWRHAAMPIALTALAIASALYLAATPPIAGVAAGEIAIRSNRLTGATSPFGEGTVWLVPGVHDLRVLTLREQAWRAAAMSRADGPAPLQSVEGLSLGADVTVRYALDPVQAARIGAKLPVNIGADIVDPALQGVIYKIVARYTVREVFSTKRAEIAQLVEAELKPRLAQEGLVLRGLQIGKIDLPADYRKGMDLLLAEEMASEKMRYTLELKDKRVKETELDAKAEKVRREITAEAAGREQVIAAKAQEEAMKHVLPWKQRQVEQRQLEAEAEKVARIKGAEATAQSRRIEAAGESEARQKLADAEAYRMEKVGRANADQMGREGELIGRYPLLIQKTLADKLSDKIQVIIAPPSAGGGFIAAGLLGRISETAVAARNGEQLAAAEGGVATKDAP